MVARGVSAFEVRLTDDVPEERQVDTRQRTERGIEQLEYQTLRPVGRMRRNHIRVEADRCRLGWRRRKRQRTDDSRRDKQRFQVHSQFSAFPNGGWVAHDEVATRVPLPIASKCP